MTRFHRKGWYWNFGVFVVVVVCCVAAIRCTAYNTSLVLDIILLLLFLLLMMVVLLVVVAVGGGGGVVVIFGSGLLLCCDVFSFRWSQQKRIRFCQMKAVFTSTTSRRAEPCALSTFEEKHVPSWEIPVPQLRTKKRRHKNATKLQGCLLRHDNCQVVVAMRRLVFFVCFFIFHI